MKKGLLALAFCFLLSGLAIGGTHKTTISVMDIDATSGLSPKELALLTDKLLNSLVEYRVYEVVERSKRDEILKEQGFQMTGACSEASCLVEIGQLLGAQKMIGGTIGKLGNVYAIELRMLDIQTGGIDLSFSRNYGKIADLLSAMKEAAEIFSSWKPGAAGQSAKPGGLFVITEPDGAKILVDGKDHPGLTPNLIYPLSEGLHQISIVKEGYSLFTTSRLVSVGKVDTVKAPLMSLAGKLKIKTDPAGAKLYLNKKFQGIVSEQGMVIEDLTDSLYKIKATKWGYKTYNAKWTPNPGRETKMDAKMPLRRWKMIPFSIDYIKNLSAKTEDVTMFDVYSSTSATTVTNADFVGSGFGGTAGVGFAFNRNITLGLLYQFRVYPGAIEKENHTGEWPDTTQLYEQLHINFLSHSPILMLAVAVPWGRLEPYGEIRFGGISGTAEIQHKREFMTCTSASPEEWTTTSSVTTQTDKTTGYKTLQAGGGILCWLRSDREALRVYWMYSRDSFTEFSLPEDSTSPWVAGDDNLSSSGLMFGWGLTVHF